MTKLAMRMKAKIERELERVNAEVSALKKEPKAEELEGLGDNTPLSEEEDAAASTEERELRADRLGRLLDRAAALDEALHRISEGTYGTCVTCGRPIADVRLEAVPEAARCARCQEDEEKASRARAEARSYEGYGKAETFEEG
jgi:RNA polymerase-binding transcription factor DksA